MKVNLETALSDYHVDVNQTSSQRQLTVYLWATAEDSDRTLLLNLCLILDNSASQL
ncbi:MAG: hypothetical protein QNJ64_08845 [Crocosphaera sp.]|nr:hypothetical protein [Crocosphaera sp.]